MNAKHTPGPWVFSGPASLEVYGFRGHYQDTPSTVAKVSGYWDGEAVANAHLIAAAPDLLNMLQRLVAESQDGPLCLCTLEHAREAIAKATL